MRNQLQKQNQANIFLFLFFSVVLYKNQMDLNKKENKLFTDKKDGENKINIFCLDFRIIFKMN